MIDVKFYRSSLCVKVEGHANSGEAGHDLVCAGVTALCYTVANFMESTCHDERMGRNLVLNLQNGRAYMRFDPSRKFKPVALLIMDSLCGGFEYLAQNESQYIKYTLIK